METSLILFISLVALVSLGFTALSVWRMMSYVSTYRFERGQYTPLFGFLPLRAIVFIYVLGSLLIASFSVGLFLSL